MRAHSRFLLRFSVVALILGFGLSFFLRGQDAPVPRKLAADPALPLPEALSIFAGNLSCSAGNCHGGVTPKESMVRQDEYTFWLSHDRHRKAYAVLKGERSKRMAKNLGLKKPAHEDARCLACHAIPQAAQFEMTPALEAWLEKQGVGCEACHGPALQSGTSWLAAHTTQQWDGKSTKEKSEHGMYPIGDLAVQAKVCAGCHIGAPPDAENNIPARDMNHDLMAAGHPRLNFELSVFRANMPPHWNIGGKGQDKAEYEAKVWSVGQVASAKAQVELTGYRAGSKDAIWPEFSETGCFACHADFQLYPDWRSRKDHYGKRVPGHFPYNAWYTAMLEAIGKHYGLDNKLMEELSAFSLAMSKISPDKQSVATKAASVAKGLEEWLNKLASKNDSEGLLKAVLAANPVSNVGKQSWDNSMQLALAIAALKQNLYWQDQRGELSANNQETLQSMNQLLQRLAFPERERASEPKWKMKYESPFGYNSRENRPELEKQFTDLFERLQK